MIAVLLLLFVANSGAAVEPPSEPAVSMPPLVLPDLACLDKNGTPLPEATFKKLDESVTVTNPVGIHRSVPPPPPPRKCKATPAVDLEFIITTKGGVCGATVVSELAPECAHYGTAALKAVKRWRFEPSRANGEPIPTRYHLRLTWH